MFTNDEKVIRICEEMGFKCCAHIMLVDSMNHNRPITIMSHDEWIGLRLFLRDGQVRPDRMTPPELPQKAPP